MNNYKAKSVSGFLGICLVSGLMHLAFASTPGNQASPLKGSSGAGPEGGEANKDQLDPGKFVNLVSGQASFQIPLGGISNFHGISYELSLRYHGGGLGETRDMPEEVKETGWTGFGFQLAIPHITHTMARSNLKSDDYFQLDMGDGPSGRLVKYEANKFVLENHPEIKLERIIHSGNVTAGGMTYAMSKTRYWLMTLPNGIRYRFGDSPQNFSCSDSEFCLPYIIDDISFQTVHNTDQSRVPIKWYLRQITDKRSRFSIWFDYAKIKSVVGGSTLDRQVYFKEIFSTNGTAYPPVNGTRIHRAIFGIQQRLIGEYSKHSVLDPLAPIDKMQLKSIEFRSNGITTNGFSFEYGSTAQGKMRLDRIQRHASRLEIKRLHHTFGYGAGSNSWRLEKITDAVGMETRFGYGAKAVSHNEGNAQFPNLSTTSFEMDGMASWPQPYISLQRQVGNFLYVCFQDKSLAETLERGMIYKFENKGNYWQYIWKKDLVPHEAGGSPSVRRLRVHLPEDGSYLAVTYYGRKPGDNSEEKNPILLLMDLTKEELAYQSKILFGNGDHFTEAFPFKDWIGIRCSGGGFRAFFNSSGTWQEASASGVEFFNDEWLNDAYVSGPGHLVAYGTPAPIHLSSQENSEFAIAKVVDGQLRRRYWHLPNFWSLPEHAAYSLMGGWRILGVAASENFIAVAFDEMHSGSAATGLCNQDWAPNHSYSVAFFPYSELDLQSQTSHVQISSLPNRRYFRHSNECETDACRQIEIKPSRFSIRASGNYVVISDPQAMKNASVYVYNPETNSVTAKERIIPGGMGEGDFSWTLNTQGSHFSLEKTALSAEQTAVENTFKCGLHWSIRQQAMDNFHKKHKPFQYALTKDSGDPFYPHRYEGYLFGFDPNPPYTLTDLTASITSVQGAESMRMGNISLVGNAFLGVKKVKAVGSTPEYSTKEYIFGLRTLTQFQPVALPTWTSNHYFCSPLSTGAVCYEYAGNGETEAASHTFTGKMRFFDTYKSGFNLSAMEVVSQLKILAHPANPTPSNTRTLDLEYSTTNGYSAQRRTPMFSQVDLVSELARTENKFQLDLNGSRMGDEARPLHGAMHETVSFPDKTKSLQESAGGSVTTFSSSTHPAAGTFSRPVYSARLDATSTKKYFFKSWQKEDAYRSDFDPANNLPRVSIAVNSGKISVQRTIFQHENGGPINDDHTQVRQSIGYRFGNSDNPCNGETQNPCANVTSTFLDGKAGKAVASRYNIINAVTGAVDEAYRWTPPSMPATLPAFSAAGPQWKLESKVISRSSDNSFAIVADDTPIQTYENGVRSAFFYGGPMANPIGQVQNSTTGTSAILNGEEENQQPAVNWLGALGDWEKTNCQVSNEVVHTGKNAIKVTSIYGPTINRYLSEDPVFWSRKKGIIFSAWIFATGTYGQTDDSQPVMVVESRKEGNPAPVHFILPIELYRQKHGGFPYNKWVKVEHHIPFTELEAHVAGPNDYLRIWMGKSSSANSNPVYVDDVRIHPVDASATTSNFDAAGRMTSTLDGNNDPVFHEYDIWNNLIGVKDKQGRAFTASSVKQYSE